MVPPNSVRPMVEELDVMWVDVVAQWSLGDIYTYIYTHTYIHSCVHAYKHTYMRTYILYHLLALVLDP